MNLAATDWVGLTDQPIEAAALRARLDAAPPAERGGVCVFEGCTRSQRHPQHGELICLEYEAYGAMAREQLAEFTRRARQRWPIGAVAIVHRTGAVAVGEPSVVIAVACGHRAEAFEACRWLIDTLKRELTIWKREVWQDGTATWSDPTAKPAG